MAIFGRKKDEENDDEEEEMEEFGVKDLKPEYKKRRREPAKPWGKKERYVVLIFFLVTALTSSVLAASSRKWKLPGLPQIKFLNFPKFNLEFLSGETITIGPGKSFDSAQARLMPKAERIKEEFDKKTKSLSGSYTFWAIDLTSGYVFGKNEEEVLTAASLIKLPVIATVFIEAENGALDLDAKPDGSNLTFRQLAEEMGKKSNNQAQLVVANYFGREKIQSVIDNLGMKDTSYLENETTAFDVGLFFQKLWNKEIVTEASRDEILNYLTDTIYEDWLKKGIPEVRVAHKYGREVHVVSDGGIIYTGNPFVLVIMTEGVVEKETDIFIPEFSAFVFKEM